MTSHDVHIKLPSFHVTLLNKLIALYGFNRTEVVKLAIWELAAKHGMVPDGIKE